MAHTVKHSFTSGEIAPELLGRSDLERYDLGVSKLHNFVVHFGGGAFKRKGLRFLDFVRFNGRLLPFQFGDRAQDSFMLIIQPATIRVMQEGAFVLEETVGIESIAGNIITIVDHGYSSGAWIYANNQIEPRIVVNATADTFELRAFGSGEVVSPVGMTEVAEVLTLNHPWDEDDLWDITFEQNDNVIKCAHPDYPTQVITLTADGWTLAPFEVEGGKPIFADVQIAPSTTYIKEILVKTRGSGHDGTTGIALTGGGGSGFLGDVVTDDSGNAVGVTIVNPGKGFLTAPTVATTGPGTGAVFRAVLPERNAGFVVTVTAVFVNGEESGPSRPKLVREHLDFTQTRGEARYSWDAIPEAEKYNVYRSLVYPDGKDIHIGLPLGFIGTTRATSFTDNNVIPDFTRTPRVYRNPSAPGRIVNASVMNGGSGYGDNPTTSVIGDGNGAVIWPIVQGGEIIGVYIANHGEGYTTAGLTIATGTGANITLSLSPESGTYPSASFHYQQRSGFGGSRNEPMTIYASKVRELDNFATQEVLAANDPYEYTVDAKKQSRIMHILPGQIGLLLFTASTVAMIRGNDGATVPATGATLDVMSFVGSSRIPPVPFEDDVLYVEAGSQSLRMLSLESASRRYSGSKISVLSSQFFNGEPLRAFAVTAAGEQGGVGIYDTGTGFAVTIDREQQVFGFSSIATQGKLIDAAVVKEGTYEVTYFMVERVFGGVTKTCIEVMKREDSLEIEDAIYLDAAISTAKGTRDYDIKTSDVSGVIRVTSDSAPFSVDDVGKRFGAGGGRGVITAYHNVGDIEVELTRPITARLPERIEAPAFRRGEWWINPFVSTISNIPFEGATVTVIGDGKMQESKVVEDGMITLDQEAAIVHVGFSYIARLSTLPITASDKVLEGRKVTVTDAVLKLRRSGDFLVGGYDVVTRKDEAWIEPTRLLSKPEVIPLSSGWDDEGIIDIVCENALPLELLQIVLEYDASDN